MYNFGFPKSSLYDTPMSVHQMPLNAPNLRDHGNESFSEEISSSFSSPDSADIYFNKMVSTTVPTCKESWLYLSKAEDVEFGQRSSVFDRKIEE